MTSSFKNFRGRPASIYEINGGNIIAGIADLGASVQYLKVKTEQGWLDLCPGFDDAEEYISSGTCFGATIGRVANRIKGASFSLNGKNYALSRNDGDNCLHGGAEGFDKRFFKVNSCGNMLELTLESADGDMGFPGNLKLKVQYVAEDGALTVRYSAVSDKDTMWAPTCHLYFNLDGAQSGDCLSNMLKINAQKFTPSEKGLVPTGEIKSVYGTPFDFTDFRAIGQRINCGDEQLVIARGYDHNFVLEGSCAATAYGTESGVKLDVYTDMPGLQLYSGNYLNGRSRFGALRPYSAFALEAQYFPDAANISAFEAPVLKAGEVKSHYIKYVFSQIKNV